MARALVLQHQRNAPPALLSDWSRARAIELVVVRADRASELGVQFHPEVTPEVAEMWGARPSGVRWLTLAGLDLGRLMHDGIRHAGRSGAAGFRLFDAFASRAASHSKHLTPAGGRT